MKKRFLSILFALMLICTLFVGCKEETYTVTAKSYLPNSTSNVKTLDELLITKTVKIEVGANDVIGDIPTPNPTSYRFCGWYTDPSYTYQWNTATDIVVGDMTLYAKWEKINK